MDNYAIYSVYSKQKVYGENTFINCLNAAIRLVGHFMPERGTYLYRSWTENTITYVDGEKGLVYIEQVVDKDE